MSTKEQPNHSQQHAHTELILPEQLVHPRVFTEIREAISTAIEADVSSLGRYEQALRNLEADADRLESLAGLSRRLVFGDGESLELFTSSLLSGEGPDGLRGREVLIDRRDDEPSSVSLDAVVDIVIGANYSALGDQVLVEEHFTAVQQRVLPQVTRIDFLHLQAQRFLKGRSPRETFLTQVDELLAGRTKPRLPPK